MSTAAISQAHEQRAVSERPPILTAVIVAVAYFIGAEIAFLIGTLSDEIFAPFWPPNIVLLCALVLTPYRDWWLYILAVLPAHIIAEVGVGMPTAAWIVAFASNCLVALLNAFAMRQLQDGPPWFGTLRKALLYILTTAVMSPALVALAGAFVPILGGGAQHNYWTFWLQWYLSNALSSLTLGPLALIVINKDTSFTSLSTRQMIEGAALAIVFAIVCAVTLRVSVDRLLWVFVPALALLPLTFVIWAAIRFGATGASIGILIATISAIQQTLNGSSPFIVASSEATVLGLQMFLIVLAVPVLLLGAATEETRNAMLRAQANQELMALSADAADSCLWQYNRTTEQLWMTENGRNMFGLSASDPLTRVSLRKNVHPDDREAAVDSMRSVSLAGGLADTEFRVIRPGSEIRWIRARGRARKDNDGDRTILSGTFTDITERKAADLEAALRRNEIAHLMRVSMLGELSGGIAHELAQPLTAILSNAQAARVLLDDANPNLAEITDAIDDIISDDNRAGEVLHRMRGLLKRGEAKFESVELNDVVSSTLQLMHSELVSRRVKVTCAFEGTLPLVCGDRVQLQQVFLNLVMNAVDSMNDQAPSRRMIAIRSKSLNEGEVEISVADQGTGLSPAQRERIFQPFFTTKERGLGLGLSICMSIAKAHSGRLILENNSTGGAIATFTLPRQN